MNIIVRSFEERDLPAMREIWNHVVDEANAFPQEEGLGAEEAAPFFAGQTVSAVAEDTESGRIVGLYILHPNNVGRCGHLANASYAVAPGIRGQHIGEKLVLDCLQQATAHGFRVLQFNAVVAGNGAARHLYEKLGFTLLGTVPGGFRLKDGSYEDICLYYKNLV